MPLPTLVFAIATAFSLGIVASVLLRAGGLLLVVAGLAAVFLLRWLAGAAHPGLLEAALLITALEFGYLAGALTPLADRIRRGPAPRPSPEPRKDAE